MIIKKVASKVGGSFGKLADYITRENDKEETLYSFSNCNSGSYVENLEEIKLTQELNTNSKQDKTLHLIVSLKEDEMKHIDKFKTIEKEIVKALDIEHHQRLSVIHTDTNNPHMHIAINKVDPETHKVAKLSQDFKILQETAEKLEQNLNLGKDNHQIKENKNELTPLPNPYTMTNQFIDFVKEKANNEISEILKNKDKTFEDLKETLASYNLELRERKGGYVIADKDRKMFCKASSISRELSPKNLEKRFANELKTSTKIEKSFNKKLKRYIKKEKILKKFDLTLEKKVPLKEKFELLTNNKFLKEYQLFERKKNQLKKEEMEKLKVRNIDIKNAQDRKDKVRLKGDLKFMKKEINKRYKKISYRDFIENKALKGDQEAIKVLQMQNYYAKRAEENKLFEQKKEEERKEAERKEAEKKEAEKKEKVEKETEKNKEESQPKNISLESIITGIKEKMNFLQPKPTLITKQGNMVYKDKKNKLNKIIDKGKNIKITYDKKDYDKTLLASLKLAGDKFEKLSINGSEEFQKKILEVVKKNNLNLNITLKNEKLNTQLLEFKKEQKQEKTKEKEQSKEKEKDKGLELRL